MRSRYGLVMLGVILGLICSAIAEPGYTQLIGTWNRYGTGCTPCILKIEEVKRDGQLVAKYFGKSSWVEGWGRASMRKEKIAVDVTLAGGGKLQLELTKNAKMLAGFAVPSNEDAGSSSASFSRVTKPGK